MTKNLLLATCAFGALGLWAGATPAAAATAAAAASDASAGASAGTGEVTELVVVAEKREQSLQKVPVAVSVFTGNQRDTMGINSVQDVTNFAPGFSYDPANVHAYIRGIGRQSINLTDDSRVDTYEDGFYVYSPYGLDKSSLFLQQEQIERGPQNVGGKNAAAGSIDMVSVRPTDEPYAEVRATVANYGVYNFEGAISGPVAPGLNFRLAAYDYNQDQGYYNNVANGISEGGVVHEWYVEPQLDWKPNDQTELWVRGFLSGWTNRGDAGARTGYTNGSWDETNLVDANAYAGGSLFVNPNYGYSAFPGAAQNAARAAGEPIPTSVTLANRGIFNNPSASNPYDFASILPRTVSLMSYNDINTTFTYDFPNVQLKYIGGYQKYDYTLNYSTPDSDVQGFTLPAGALGGPMAINSTVDLNYAENDEWWSHELSFQSTNDSPLQWTVGGFFYQQHYSNPISDTAPDQSQFANPVTVASVTNFLGGAGPLVAAPSNPNNYMFYENYDFTYQDWAGYGQLSYKLNDQVKITGNIRYTGDHKWGFEEDRDVSLGDLGTFNYLGTVEPILGANTPAVDETISAVCPTGNSKNCYSGALAPGVTHIGTMGPGGFETRDLGGSSSAVTGGAGVEWTPTNDIFMYARYDRGYEALAFYAGSVGANPEVSPEFINSYQVGYKETFGQKLLIDIDGFYYDYDNMQVPLSINTTAGVQTEFINVPKAESTGAEIEAYWTPIHNLSITAQWSFDYTAIETGCSGKLSGGVLTPASGSLCIEDVMDPDAIAPGAKPYPGQTLGSARLQSVKGNALPDAPENKASIDVAYTWHFQPGSFTLSGDYVWRGSQDGTLFNRFYDNAPSWDDVDLRGLWKAPDDKYEIIGYVKNIFNTQQYIVANQGVGLYGNNAAVLSAASGLNWANIFELAPPRTYGVEVRYKFF